VQGLIMAKKTYYEKLKDPRWQKKRLEVMEWNNFCCEVCGDDSTTLNVHHKEYFKNQEPWDYDKKQLSCVCENCHEEQHSNIDLLKFVCSYLNLDGPANREEVAFLIAGYAGYDYQSILGVAGVDDTRVPRESYKAGVKARGLYEKGVKAAFLREIKNGKD
jgi:hypothetical protein